MKRALLAALAAALLAACESGKLPSQDTPSPLVADLVDYRAALTMLREGRTDEALQLLRRAQSAHPRDPNVLNATGLVYIARRDWPGAVKSFTQALAIDPSLMEARNNRGVAYMESGKLDLSKADFEAVLDGTNPKEKANAHYNLGLLSVRRADWKAAERAFSQALAQDPRYRRAYRDRGMARVQLEDFRSALDDLLQALKDDPKDPIANYQAALCLLTTGRRDLAMKYMERAASAAPESEEGKRAKRFLDNEGRLEETP